MTTENISTLEELREAIRSLEIQQAEDGVQLKAQFLIVYETMKPVNFVKDTIINAVTSPEVKQSLMNSSIGLATGFIAKLAVQSVMRSPMNKLVGSAVMMGVKNIVERNPEAIKTLSGSLFNFLKRKANGRAKNNGSE